MDKIIRLFIENPEKEFYVREISRLVKKSPTTVSNNLKSFEKEGLIKSTKVSNHLFFRSDPNSFLFKQLKKEYNQRIIRSSGIIDFIEDQFNHPEAIILFGSFAKGEDIISSDIDLFIITPINKEVSLQSFEKKLKHNIQLFLASRKDIDEMKSKNKELLNNLVNGTVLSGYWEVFR